MNADGSSLTNLTNNPADDGGPAWSPDGRQIAFVSDRDGDSEIYVMNADGSHQTNLTDNPEAIIWPAWSPDGRQIAFDFRVRDGNTDIYVVNADGSSPTNLANPRQMIGIRPGRQMGARLPSSPSGRVVGIYLGHLRDERGRLQSDQSHQ